MTLLSKNYGTYGSANVKMYLTTNSSRVSDKVGQYYLVAGMSRLAFYVGIKRSASRAKKVRTF